MVVDYVKEYEKRTKLNRKNINAIIIPDTIQAVLDRHNRNLKEMKKKNFKYFYSPEVAEYAVEWIGKNIKEEKTGLSLSELGFSGFQTLIIALVFGWREKPDGFTMKKLKDNHYTLEEQLLMNRRFKEILLTCSRKQGKSMLLNAINIFDLFSKTKKENQCVYIANTHKQAKITFDMFSRMLKKIVKSEETGKLEELVIFSKEIIEMELPTGSSQFKAEVRSSNIDGADGADVSNLFYDELATATDEGLYSVYVTSQLHQENKLNILTSTATDKPTSIMNTKFIPYHKKNNLPATEENKVDEEKIGFIFIQDDLEELNNLNEKSHDEILNIFMKSNPILDINKKIKIKNGDYSKRSHYKYLITTYEEAIKTNSLDNFKVKHLNMFIRTKNYQIVTDSEWDSLELKISREEFYRDKIRNYEGSSVILGLDYARVNDLASIASILKVENSMIPDGEEKYTHIVDSISLVPYVNVGSIENKAIQDESRYLEYIEEGWSIPAKEENKGAVTLDDYVDKVVEIINFYQSHGINVQTVCYDRYGLAELPSKLMEKTNLYDEHLVEVQQNFRGTGRMVIPFQNDVITRNIRHIGNPNLKEHLLNLSIKKVGNNGQNNILDKAKSNLKIDNAIALLMAYQELPETELSIDYNADEFSLFK